MIPVRKKIEIQEGVTVDLLFTPHLYSYKGRFGVTFETDPNDNFAVTEHFADLFFCAALNAWELDGMGAAEDFPYKRGDFHALIVSDPAAFGKTIDFALYALTGKTKDQLSGGAEKGAESKKKAHTSWIGRLLRRSSSASAGRRNEKRH